MATHCKLIVKSTVHSSNHPLGTEQTGEYEYVLLLDIVLI